MRRGLLLIGLLLASGLVGADELPGYQSTGRVVLKGGEFVDGEDIRVDRQRGTVTFQTGPWDRPVFETYAIRDVEGILPIPVEQLRCAGPILTDGELKALEGRVEAVTRLGTASQAARLRQCFSLRKSGVQDATKLAPVCCR